MKPSGKRKIVLVAVVVLILLAIGAGTYVKNKTPYKNRLFQVYYYRVKLRIPIDPKTKNEYIFDAIEKKDYSSVESLVRKNRELINIINDRHGTPLMFAISKGDERMTALLIAAGSDLKGAMNLAACEGQVEIAKLLIASGASLESWDEKGRPPLHCAAMYGRNEMVELLIENGANIDSSDTHCDTPLHCAASQGFIRPSPYEGISILGHLKIVMIEKETRLGSYRETVKTLIKHGAKIDLKDSMKRTPLHMAAKNGLMSLERLHHKIDTTKETILEKSEENLEIAELLVKSGANIEVRDCRDQTPFILAVRCGNRRVAKYLLKKGAKIYHNNVTWELDHNIYEISYPVFSCTALWGMPEVCQAFINEGYDVNGTDKQDITPLYYASLLINIFDKFEPEERKKEKIKVAEVLLNNGAEINKKLKNGQTALHAAARTGFHEIIPLLLSKGADIEAVDKKGFTPVMSAVFNNDVILPEDRKEIDKAILTLIQHGATIDKYPKDKHSFLHASASGGYTKVVEALLSRGFDVNLRDADGNTPLHIAVEKEKEETVIFLLSRGASVNVKNGDGNTPLHLACKTYDDKITKILISNGADVHSGDKNGATPLHIASEKGRENIALLLIEKGADVNARDRSKKTPIFYSLDSFDEKMTGFLIMRGAKANAIDNKGRNPLHYCADSDSRRSNKMEWLIKYGADVNLKDKSGKTPLDYAENRGRKENIDTLIKHGAK